MDATPFRRDVLKELAEACRRRGLRLGFYYSQAQDWHEPDGVGNTWDFGPDEKKDFDRYLREKAEPQVRELLTGYGPVALVWFDTPRMMTAERAQRFTGIVRSLQPDTLIDGRLGAAGDYVSTGDNVIPSAVGGEAWETPATINHTWGYRKDDHDWKSPGDVAFFREPRVPFELPAMKNAVKRAWRLADGAPVEVRTVEGRPALAIERPVIDPMATVVVVEIEGDRVER